MVHKRRRYHTRHHITKFHIFLYITFFATCMLMLSFYFEILPSGIRIEHSQNYFIETEMYSSMDLIVNTSGCQILDINKWDPSIMPFVKKNKHPPDCKLKGKQLTFVRDSKIVINSTTLKSLGHSLETVSCCYKTITRVEESLTNYNSSADNLFKYSEECYKMEEETYPNSQFLKVFCKKTDSSESVAYENYHAVALMPKQNQIAERKINYWKSGKNKDSERPPNVILVGIDSTSRLNLQRFAPKTIHMLERMGAVELRGYNKVGENTFPNFIPIMSSYSEDDLKKICYFNRNVLMDDCPFIWKDFTQANYLTAHLEDSPKLAIFNYVKTGFVKAPVDYYLRPFMLAVHKDYTGSPYILDCLGYQSVEEVITNYMADLIKLTTRENIPLFLTSWLTNLSHEDMNDLRFADDTFKKFLERLQKERALNNTILFFMSDHGYRFGNQRQSISGWYEDKLPALWIYISPDLQSKYPGWRHTLAVNSKRLSTPFDIHKSFVHILNAFSPAAMKNMTIRRKRQRNTLGQSLFSELPYERNCDTAGIPDNYCACVPPIKLPLNDSILLEAAETAVARINSRLPLQCTDLALYSLIGGAYLDKSKFTKHKTQSDIIIVAFITKPGKFLFEALVNYSRKKNKFTITSDILRMNRINTPTGCIQDPGLEVFCYC